MKQEDTKQGNQQKMQKEAPHMSGNPAQPDVQQKQEYEWITFLFRYNFGKKNL